MAYPLNINALPVFFVNEVVMISVAAEYRRESTSK